jgi:hypothetical protein
MRENDEDEQHSEQSGRHGKEVHRRHLVHVILQEWSPALRGRPTVPAQIFAHSQWSHVDPELEQFAVNAGRSWSLPTKRWLGSCVESGRE